MVDGGEFNKLFINFFIYQKKNEPVVVVVKAKNPVEEKPICLLLSF